MSPGGTDMSNTLDQNCRCEFCCGMHQTCKKHQCNNMTRSDEPKYRYVNIYINRITVDVDGKKQQRYTISPPRCDLNAPRGGTIHIYIYISAGA